MYEQDNKDEEEKIQLHARSSFSSGRGVRDASRKEGSGVLASTERPRGDQGGHAMTMPYVAIGALGGGLNADSMDAAVKRGIDFIGADGGSTDIGPSALAGHGTIHSEASTRHDIELCLRSASEAGVPLLVGSCGTSGRDWGVDWIAGMVRDWARKEGKSLRVVKIYTELDKDYVKGKLRDGKLHALHPQLPYDADTVDRSERIVAVMGVEAFQHALEMGADVVLAGRASDAAIFAAYPIAKGIPPEVAWHAGKTAECGAAAATPPKLDCLYVRLDKDSFEVEAMDENLRCTPMSVAAFQLYESADPFRLTQPSGVLDTTNTRYEPISDRAVRVSGASFEPRDGYTLKIEGVEFVGWRKFFILSVRDPVLIEHFDEWLESALEKARKRVLEEQSPELLEQTDIRLHPYGVSGTMGGWEPTPRLQGHEALLFVTVTSKDPEVAETVANIVWYVLLHHTTPHAKGYATLGIPYAPAVLDMGKVYAFNANHVIEVESPIEPFRFVVEEVNGL